MVSAGSANAPPQRDQLGKELVPPRGSGPWPLPAPRPSTEVIIWWDRPLTAGRRRGLGPGQSPSAVGKLARSQLPWPEPRPMLASVSPSAGQSVGAMVQRPPSLPAGILGVMGTESGLLTFPELTGQAGGVAGAARASRSCWHPPGSPRCQASGLGRLRSRRTEPLAEARTGIWGGSRGAGRSV